MPDSIHERLSDIKKAGAVRTHEPAAERPLPHDYEAERWVLGSCLWHPTVAAECSWLKASDFWDDNNRRIWNAIKAVGDLGAELDKPDAIDEWLALAKARVTAVYGELDRLDLTDDVGGRSTLSKLIEELPTATGADFYARALRRLACYRDLIDFGSHVVQVAYRSPDDVEAQMDSMLRELESIRMQVNLPQAAVSMSKVTSDADRPI